MTFNTGAITVNVNAKHRIYLNQYGLPLIIPLLTSGPRQNGILVHIATFYVLYNQGRTIATWSTDHSIAVPLQSVVTAATYSHRRPQ